jgi:hypothetical protein
LPASRPCQQGYHWTVERFGKYTRTLSFSLLAESPNQKVLMLPIEAMNVLGSLAGIGEIVKATFGGDGGGGASAAARRPTVPAAGPPARA